MLATTALLLYIAYAVTAASDNANAAYYQAKSATDAAPRSKTLRAEFQPAVADDRRAPSQDQGRSEALQA